MFGRFLDWFERHKFGVVGALMLHTLFMFTMAMVKLDKTQAPPAPKEIVLELEAPPEVPPTPEELAQQERMAQQEMLNRVSDVNANPERSLSRAARERMAEDVEQDLRDMEQAEFQRLAAERTAEGRDIVQPTLDPSKFDPKNYMHEKPKAVKVEGNVAVRVNVPGRQNLDVDVPAYLCKGRGIVLVRVTVDRNGRVSKAEVDPAGTNTSDDCLLSRALGSAQAASFDRGTGASNGTIEYTFQAQ